MSGEPRASSRSRDQPGNEDEKRPPFPRYDSHPFRPGWNVRTVEYLSENRKESQLNDDSGIDSSLSSESRDPSSKTILQFEEDDPGNPYNWSKTKKALVVLLGVISVINSTIGSSLPSGDIPELSKHYGVTSEEQLVLPNSMYLVGYVLGPLLFAPLSEQYGRQIIMLSTFAGMTLFTMAVALAPDWPTFIVFRLIVGTFASSPISVVGGTYADMYDNIINRGRAMAAFMVATSTGPIAGPIISGYLGVYSWEWPFWFALILCGVTWIPFAFFPETSGDIILARRAKKIRKKDPSSNVYAACELEKKDLGQIVTTVLTRPITMFCFEPMVFSTCIYLAFVYGILYMFFQSFVEIYPPIYGFTEGETGLAFLAIPVGTMTAAIIYLTWDKTMQRAKAKGKTWQDSEEYRRLPLGLIGGPCLTIGLFWIGWTARSDIPWIVPIVGAYPFGIGFMLLFMALINYLVDAYDAYAASALAASSFSRSLFGAVLPFGSPPLFENLGVPWACTLLGILSGVMALVPFLFIRFGPWIRQRSPFCRELAEQRQQRQREQEQKRERSQSA